MLCEELLDALFVESEHGDEERACLCGCQLARLRLRYDVEGRAHLYAGVGLTHFCTLLAHHRVQVDELQLDVEAVVLDYPLARLGDELPEWLDDRVRKKLIRDL